MDNYQYDGVCNGNAIVEYDKRRPALSNAPLNVEYDNNCIGY